MAQGLDPQQFVVHVIRPTLAALDWYSPAAERLLLGTALTESGLCFVHQLGRGPALGVYQMEPATHDDIWRNFLPSQEQALRVIRKLRSELFPGAQGLAGNLYYATAMCRAHYRRVPEPLPDAEDAMDMAQYHKRFYNTSSGVTDPTKSSMHFYKAIELCRELS